MVASLRCENRTTSSLLRRSAAQCMQLPIVTVFPAAQAGDMLSEQAALEQRAESAKATAARLATSQAKLTDAEERCSEQSGRLEVLEMRVVELDKVIADPCLWDAVTPS